MIHNNTPTSMAAADSVQPHVESLRDRVLAAGSVVGRWTLIEHTTRLGSNAWLCRCSCGIARTVVTKSLTSGASRSCGCLSREVSAENGRRNAIHGWKDSKTYRVWSHMKERCERRSHKSWPDYGGRGIKVCDRWQNFESFLSDMGPVPERLTLERIDVNGNYTPENCRWASRTEQARNRRSTRLLTAFGETKPAASWLEDGRCSANRTTFYKRIASGWDDRRAIVQPMRADCRRAVTP